MSDRHNCEEWCAKCWPMPTPAAPSEPVAWEYEVATWIDANGVPMRWSGPHLSHTKPNVPEGAVRNIVPLHTRPAPREGVTEPVAESASERFDRHADAFTEATGFTSLGRSHPMALGGFDEEKRSELWHAFQAGLKTAYAATRPTPAPCEVTAPFYRNDFFEVLCPDGGYVGNFERREYAEAYAAGRKGFEAVASTFTRTALHAGRAK